MQHAVPQPFGCDVVKQLKLRLTDALPKKLEITTAHKMALFLHPQYKNLRKLSPDDKAEVHSFARGYTTVLKKRDQVKQSDTSNPYVKLLLIFFYMYLVILLLPYKMSCECLANSFQYISN